MALTGLEAAALAADAGETLIDGARGRRRGARSGRVRPAGRRHYDVVSAFIKSIRGSDPDAALFWLARMIEAGEDPRFIARRLIVHRVRGRRARRPDGAPVAPSPRHTRSSTSGCPRHGSTSRRRPSTSRVRPKSNSVTDGVWRRVEDAVSADPVPTHLRDASYAGAAKLGHGKGYVYPHDFEGHLEQEYRPVRFEATATTSRRARARTPRSSPPDAGPTTNGPECPRAVRLGGPSQSGTLGPGRLGELPSQAPRRYE